MDGGDLFGALPYLAEAHRLDREKALPDWAHRLRLAAVLRQCPKLVQLWFHRSGVCYTEFSRDGRRVLTASFDGTTQVWDTVTGAPIGRRFKGPSLSLHLVPLGTTNRDTLAGRPVKGPSRSDTRVVSGPSSRPTAPQNRSGDLLVPSASFSPDGQQIVTISDERAARVWNIATGEPVGKPFQQDGAVRAVSFSPDGGTSSR